MRITKRLVGLVLRVAQQVRHVLNDVLFSVDQQLAEFLNNVARLCLWRGHLRPHEPGLNGHLWMLIRGREWLVVGIVIRYCTRACWRCLWHCTLRSNWRIPC